MYNLFPTLSPQKCHFKFPSLHHKNHLNYGHGSSVDLWLYYQGGQFGLELLLFSLTYICEKILKAASISIKIRDKGLDKSIVDGNEISLITLIGRHLNSL
jgi:hypothetical protein